MNNLNPKDLDNTLRKHAEGEEEPKPVRKLIDNVVAPVATGVAGAGMMAAQGLKHLQYTERNREVK